MSQLSDTLLEVVHSLIPVYGQDDFDDIFEVSAGHFSVGDQYKIRNEVIRLCEPCEKVIDLRGEVSETCRKFLHKGRVHYLDALARETFEQGLELYGRYTVGIWEEVTNTGNNFRVMQARAEQERLNAEKYEKQRKAEKLQNILATRLHYSDSDYPVHVIHFGDYFNRGEERMNYAVSAELTFADGRKVQAVTKDLSVKGVFLRVPLSEKVELDDVVKVVMADQGLKYKESAKEGVEYQVKRIECIDKVIWLGLNRTFSEAQDSFTGYVEELIACNKFVYKVNLDNAIDAVLKLGHEQVFFARNMTMAFFIEDLHGQKRLRYALTSGPNEENLRFFCDESNRQHLTCLFSPTVVQQLIADESDECLLYCFSHRVENNLIYFAAFSWQFEAEPELKRLFVGYGCQKDSWKVFRVKRIAIDSNDAQMVFVVPSKVEAVDENNSQPKAEPLETGNLSHALMLTEIADPISAESYKARGYDSALMPKIARFQLSFNERAAPLQWVRYGLEELRHEPRFAYKTKVFVTFGNGMRLESTSVDFSARGVQVSLPKAVQVKRGDGVLLAFPLLQKITRQLKLERLEYRVVRVENDWRTLYLQAVELEEMLHHGVKFFKDLIKRNQHKLTLVSETSEQQQLTKVLKNLVQKPLVSIPFYINRVSGQLRLTKLVGSSSPHPLLTRLKSDEFMGKVNIAALMGNRTFADFMTFYAKEQVGAAEYRSIGVFVAITDEAICVRTDIELNSEILQRNFVRSAQEQGEFYCFRAYLFSVQRVQLRKIADELEYIHHYAQHKSKYVAESLIRISCVGEMVDVTGFVCDYLGIKKAG